MAAFLALGLLFAAPLLGNVPIAALVGVMLLVCQSTFAWSSLRLVNKIPKVDLFCIAVVSLVTVYRDLAQVQIPPLRTPDASSPPSTASIAARGSARVVLSIPAAPFVRPLLALYPPSTRPMPRPLR